MLDIVTGEELRLLAAAQSQYCVSIYLPTDPAIEDQGPIRLKNLLRRAAEELATLGVRSPDVGKALSGAETIRADGQWWANVGRGAALFGCDGAWRSVRLPGPVSELVVVADRFHLKPLLTFLADGTGFHILALSENRVRLLEADRYTVSEVESDEIPASAAQVLQFDDRESQLHSHSADRVGPGRVVSGFHGHGGSADFSETDRSRFLHAVDAGLRHTIGDASGPLVLAGVNDLVARFRALTSHRNLIEEPVGGNPDKLSAQKLQERAWPLVAPRVSGDRRVAEQAIATGSKPTSVSLQETVLAAVDGRVAQLFVPVAVQRWGVFDEAARAVVEHDQRKPGDRDLLDLAAIETVAHRGSVLAVDAAEMPGGNLLAAVLRY